MTVREAIGIGSDIIAERWKETPRLDASVILASVLGTTRDRLLSGLSDPLNQADYDTFISGVMERASGSPVAYITHHQEFYALDFYVDNRVLVPRADTEILVEKALEYIKPKNRVLDLCTGSGCIAIAIKHNVPDADVSASDISDGALEVFRKNCSAILDKEILTYKSDLLNSINEKFDIIISNPPYLTNAETSRMKSDRWPEPELALDGGEDGLDFIRKIIQTAPKNLTKRAHLLFEADPEQMNSIKSEFEKYKYNDIVITKDLAGRDRVISGCFNG